MPYSRLNCESADLLKLPRLDDVEDRPIRVYASYRRLAVPVVHVPLRGRDPLEDRGRRKPPVTTDDEGSLAPVRVGDQQDRQPRAEIGRIADGVREGWVEHARRHNKRDEPRGL